MIFRIIPVLVCFLLISPFSFGQYNLDKFYTEARQELAKNNYTSAISRLDLLVKYKPDQFDLYFLRGFAKYCLEDFTGAIHDFSKTININPFYTEAYHYRALSKDRMEDPAGAISDYNTAIKLDSANGELYVERALIKLYGHRYKECIADCDKALDLKLQNKELLYICRGWAYAGIRNYEEALRDYNKAIGINPFNPNSYVRRGVIRGFLGLYEEAKQDMGRALKIDSLSAFAYYNRALLEYEHKDYKAAAADYDKVIQYAPRNSSAYYNRGVNKLQLSDTKGALEDFSRALLLSPDNIVACFGRAKLYHSLGDHKNALKDYNKVIQLFPYHTEAFYNRAILKEAMGIKGAAEDHRLAKSISELNRLKGLADVARDSVLMVTLTRFKGGFEDNETSFGRIQNKKTDIRFEPVFYLSVAGMAEGQEKKYFCRELDLYNSRNKTRYLLTNSARSGVCCPDNAFAAGRGSDSMMVKGIERSLSMFYNDAREAYSRALEYDSAFAWAYFNRASLICKNYELVNSFGDNNFDKDDFKTALADLDRVIKLEPDLPYAYYNRAYVYSYLNDLNSAVKDYTTCIRKEGDLAEAYFNRGLVFILLKDSRNACNDLSRAGELGLNDAYPVIKRFCN